MLDLVTPDSERTMCTFLGTAGKITKMMSVQMLLNKAKLFLEGYLWDEENPKKHLKKLFKVQ